MTSTSDKDLIIRLTYELADLTHKLKVQNAFIDYLQKDRDDLEQELLDLRYGHPLPRPHSQPGNFRQPERDEETAPRP